jgi:hypothetical protein
MPVYLSTRSMFAVAVVLLCSACASGGGNSDSASLGVKQLEAQAEAAQSPEEKARLLGLRDSLMARLRLAVSKLGLTGPTETVTASPANSSTTGTEGAVSGSASAIAAAAPVAASVGTQFPAVTRELMPRNPVLFTTQVPITATFGTRSTAFANHGGTVISAPRGGDLMIRYPDGSLRNLTKEAGYGSEGFQGANAIAVREPAVHWDGTKALFSMVIGSPTKRYVAEDYVWQIYEVSGLGKGETVKITKVLGQPTGFNNITPIYGPSDEILFTSDSPQNGERHLYPQLDEYESTATVTGIFRLDRTTGVSKRLNHAISGAFNPTIDSFGRIIFVRWDHLQRDQQADNDKTLGISYNFGSHNFSSEASTASKLPLLDEVFPESRLGQSSKYGPVRPFNSNTFMPWEMNPNGTGELSLNHVGRHEFFFRLIPSSFTADPNLKDIANPLFRANQFPLQIDGGMYQVREDPIRPGHYFAVQAREFAPNAAGAVIEFNGPPGLSPEKMQIRALTAIEEGSTNQIGGRFKNPVGLSNGAILVSHTPIESQDLPAGAAWNFRLKMVAIGAAGKFEIRSNLTGGIRKAVSWWDPDNSRTFDGELWELDPVEVKPTSRPTVRSTPVVETPEKSVFNEEGVNEADFRNWLVSRNLALIITRNNTSRDRSDVQQPFNLAVPNGTRSVVPGGGTVYEISNFQIFQADMLRGYGNGKSGRRALATQSEIVRSNNPPISGPVGSVQIALDGSSAALVPTGKAITWQLTDPSGEPVVRERNWITFQPGEIRTCAGCHAINETDQLGRSSPVNKPEALRALLRYWKNTR